MFAAGLVIGVFLLLTFAAWRRHDSALRRSEARWIDDDPGRLHDRFGEESPAATRHQQGVAWLHEVFERSARRFPDHVALSVPASRECLTYAELDARAEAIASALAPWLDGPDRIVAVAMPQDSHDIVAAHLGILKAGAAVVVLDPTAPAAIRQHLLEDTQPVVVLTCGVDRFEGRPTLNVRDLPTEVAARRPPPWLDDPRRRLATVFYTSGTTGTPKGVECLHAGYVNLAASYADYFDLVPGVDATSLTSSLGYDGSISEMYSAWVSGCEVVLLTPEQVRSGPDLLPVLRESEVTVLFCPPVLLSTLTASPERDLPYPLCRFIVPAGEAFPPALVEPWTRARRQVINTYGPTEASTDTSRQVLRTGEDVTIGTPFPNVTYAVLAVGALEELPFGEVGELCIGGVHLARGYRNLPEQTAEKFIEHPRLGRLYRTGDTCRIDSQTHRVHFLGRIDNQFKVRGHRVEAQPVEDLLQRAHHEVESAVLDYRNEELIAFIAAPSLLPGDGVACAPAPSDWSRRVLGELSRRLPEPSVPSRIFVVRRFVLQARSGKIDRASLPDVSDLVLGPESAPPDEDAVRDVGSAVETPVREALDLCREVLGAGLGADDSFADHGGHSIVMARLAQRAQAAGWRVSVRDLLSDCGTARRLATRPRGPVPGASSHGGDPGPAVSHPTGDAAAARILPVAGFTLLQILFASILYAPAILGLVTFTAFANIQEFVLTASPVGFLFAGGILYLGSLCAPFAHLAWCMCVRRAWTGFVLTPGIYPKWSQMHLRVWCVGRLQASVLRPLSAQPRSSRLMGWALRGLGAQIGSEFQCASNAEFAGPLSLLTAGHRVSIQPRALISLSTWIGQELHVGPVRLGDRCTVGARAGVFGGVTLGNGTWVTPLTPVRRNTAPGSILDGAPARDVGRRISLRRLETWRRLREPSRIEMAAGYGLQVVLEGLLVVLPASVIGWLAARASEAEGAADHFLRMPLLAALGHVGLTAFAVTSSTILVTSLLTAVFLRMTRFRPGLYFASGFTGSLLRFRLRAMDQLQRTWGWSVMGQYLRALAGLRFDVIGASECDVMYDVLPELVRAELPVFWSHGSCANLVEQDAGFLRLGEADLPSGFFAGNNCVIEPGQYPGRFLVGVSTPASGTRFRRQMRTRPDEATVLAGHPPLRFGRADRASSEDARPGFALFLARVVLGDVLRIGVLPVLELLAYTVFVLMFLRFEMAPTIAAGVSLICAEGTLFVLAVGVTRVLVGTWGRDDTAPFWSLRHFTYFFAQDCFFAWCRRWFRFSAGTVIANVLLRRFGCVIGKRTLFVAPLQAFDWNAVQIGRDCIVDGMLQLHTFEDMVLRSKRSRVGHGSCLGVGSTLMGGAEIAPGASVLPFTLVMKEVALEAGVHEGSPAEKVYEPEKKATASAPGARLDRDPETERGPASGGGTR